MQSLKDLFLLEPKVVFLNHGSFGATPKKVFEVYQEWQGRLEQQPVKFLGRDLPGYLGEARASLGQYLGAYKDDLVFVPNATFGVNVVARSLKLDPSDEVLTSNHEYGACDNIWAYLSKQQGFVYKRQMISFPIISSEAMLEQLWRGVTPRTKVIFLSHLTSPTALTFPIEEICKRAREQGIITVIDGAHAPGQLELNLQTLDADFYTGNCHKWMCSPKGAGFLYVRRDMQEGLEPVIIGWGLTREPSQGRLQDYYEWLGTNDFAAYLSVPAAIEFQKEHDWSKVQVQCHELLVKALEQAHAIAGQPSMYPDDTYYRQLAVITLPKVADLNVLKARLYDKYQIEIPLTEHDTWQFARLSVQAYNTGDDVERLLEALKKLL